MRPSKPCRSTAALVGLLFSVAVVACSSDGDKNENGTSPADAKTFFANKVHPQLAATCKECHQTGKNGAPVFLGANGDASYTAMLGFPGMISAPSFSPIIQKGRHSGPALTQTENDLVTQWLKLEVVARNLGADPGTPKNLRAAFKAFGACMDYGR